MTSHTPPREGLGQRGYSMVEILLVLTLMAIVLALAAPDMSGFVRSSRLEQATQMLSGDVAATRMAAVRAGQPATLTVVPPASYEITVVGDTTPPMKRVDLAGEFPGVALTGGPVTFNSRGLVVGSAGGTFVTGDVSFTIAVGERTETLQVSPVGRIYRDD